MKTILSFYTIMLLGAIVSLAAETLRPPAVPLVACDPYFSIWSQADNLTDVDTTHWTGKPHRLTSLVRIDGKPFRLMGKCSANVPALSQTSVAVLPTRTIYTFAGGGIKLTLIFMTPMLPDDLDVLSRPVTYLTWTAAATDRQTHKVEIYFDASGEIAVNLGKQQVNHSQCQIGKLDVLEIGSVEQPVLEKSGDDLRIDWGHLYLALPKLAGGTELISPRKALCAAFVNGGVFVPPDIIAPDSTNADSLVAAAIFSLGDIGNQPVSRWLILAYDDEYSIQYMHKNLRPYWRRNGDDATALLKKSAAEYKSLQARCKKFDAELMADLREAGGEQYSLIAALAYRQCFAAGKFVADANGQPLQFCKENHSNGCISTSDVFYPMSPQFLLFGPTLAKSFVVPFMNYSASARWKFPFAPHDLGTYPHANGQVYGGAEHSEENQMPVEESGNLLILFAAIAQMEGNANFAGLYWNQLEKWADYLRIKGFDPENQLCTDDFAGHLAHNVNLSAKAICGLASFARLCELRGDHAKANEYFILARDFAAKWTKHADDGDHFRLAFDKPGTWSQKYNLVWDRILGLNLWPDDVRRKEMVFYRHAQNPFGLALDNRESQTKLDWISWTATLTQNRADFEALIDPILKFLNETTDRSPMTDWYYSDNGRKKGFTARPVVGGVFLQMLYDKSIWQKWANRDKTKAGNWSPIPPPSEITTVTLPPVKAPVK